MDMTWERLILPILAFILVEGDKGLYTSTPGGNISTLNKTGSLVFGALIYFGF